MPTFLSVFSGIGGFDLGLIREGWTCLGQIENDPFCRRVLQRHWPDVPKWGDIQTVTVQSLQDTGEGSDGQRGIQGGHDCRCPASTNREQGTSSIDLLCGGFPCQDLSVAGKRAGLQGARSGLFFEFMRLARDLSPSWLLLENVPGLLSSANGRDFTRLLYELEQSGYWWAYRILDSRWFGVPQRRRRVFIIGHLGGPVPPAILFEPESRAGDSQARGEAGADLAYSLAAGAGGSKFGSGRDGQDTFVIANALEACTPASRQRGDGSDNQIIAAPLTAGSSHQSHMPGRRREDDENLVIPIQYVEQWGRDKRQNGVGLGSDGDPSFTLDASYPHHVGTMQVVRRLTPLECERLQNFPDGHTCLCGYEPYSTAACTCPDSPRYRALGNAVTVSVVQWIARRLRDAHERYASR